MPESEAMTAESDTIAVRNPYTGDLVGHAPALSADDVDRAVNAAAKYDFGLSGWDRYEILSTAARLLRERQSEFANLITNEIGISLKDSLHETDRAFHVTLLSAEEAKRIEGEVCPAEVSPGLPRHLAIVVKEPVGVVACITPFNHPLNQVVHKVCPAIAANNAVVLKPSEKCPLTAMRFAELLIAAGLPSAMLQIITGDSPIVGPPIVKHPGINMISFTGSTAVGEYIARHSGIKRLSLELGGNDILVIAPDAPLDRAVDLAAQGAFGNSGQRCSSTKRIVTFPNNHDDFAAALAERAECLVVGDPFDPTTDIGTVINEEAARVIERRIHDAVADGATVLAGGTREGAVVWPTVLDHVDPDSELVAEETFGPVAPLIDARDMDHAVQIANTTPYGLNAAVVTNDLNVAMDFARRVRTGGIRINQAPSFRNEFVPFGGNKMSGFGRSGVQYAVREMTNAKTIIIA